MFPASVKHSPPNIFNSRTRSASGINSSRTRSANCSSYAIAAPSPRASLGGPNRRGFRRVSVLVRWMRPTGSPGLEAT